MEPARNPDLVGPPGIVDAAINDLLASTTCSSRQVALLNAAALRRLSEVGDQTDNRMLRTLHLPRFQIVRPLDRLLPRIMLHHVIVLMCEVT